MALERRLAARERDAVVGLQRGRLAVAGDAVGRDEADLDQLALGERPVGRARRGAERERAPPLLEPQLAMPPLARIPAENSRQKTSCSIPVPASAPFSAGPSVRSRTTRNEPHRERQR